MIDRGTLEADRGMGCRFEGASGGTCPRARRSGRRYGGPGVRRLVTIGLLTVALGAGLLGAGGLGTGGLGAGASPCQAEETLRYPLSAAVAEDGTIYIADRNLPGIWQVRDGRLGIYFQASKKYRTPLNAVRCVALDNEGRLLAGDSATRDVYRFDEEGQPQPLTQGRIGIPMDIAVAEDGTLLVSDLELHRIVTVPAEGGEPRLWAEARGPRGLARAADGGLWVLTRGEDQLVRINAEGKQEAIVPGQPLPFPQDVVVDDQGVLGEKGAAYISDNYARAIWKVPPGRKPEKWVEGPPLVNPVGLALTGGKLLVVDSRAAGLFQITPDKQVEPLPLATEE